MNMLKLEILESQFGAYDTNILIDDRKLTDIIKEWELKIAEDASIAGSYVGTAVYSFCPESPYLLDWLGLSKDVKGKAVLLECGDCGFSGCWPLLAKVEATETTVIWKDFEQPHRGIESSVFWDYSGFGPFVFDRYEYEKTVSSFSHEAEQARLSKSKKV